MEVHYSSKSNEWATPQNLFDELNDEFNFTLDPCATDENAKCSKYFTIEDNGLSKDWSNDVVIMNPPYGREIKKMGEESIRRKLKRCDDCLFNTGKNRYNVLA